MIRRDVILAGLTTEGQSLRDIRLKIGKQYSASNISAILAKLEGEGLAAREKLSRPNMRGKTVDLRKVPKVLWRKL